MHISRQIVLNHNEMMIGIVSFSFFFLVSRTFLNKLNSANSIRVSPQIQINQIINNAEWTFVRL